MNNFLQ